MSLVDRVDKNGNTEISVSVIILAHNQLPLTIECLESVLLTRPEGMPLQVVLMDNGSTDETAAWIRRQSKLPREDGVVVSGVYSSENRGFAGGCNEALRHSSGDIVIFLNNDTIVTPGWLTELITPLVLQENHAISAPVSNYVGGVQMINAPYEGSDQMLIFASQNYEKNKGKYQLAGMVSGLCIALRRDTIEKLKGFHCPPDQLFDESFFPGMWEDNDLSLRVQLLGMKCVVCYGAFIHHEGSATFKQIGNTTNHFIENKKRFEEKWAKIYPKHQDQSIAVMLRVKNGEQHIDRFIAGVVGWANKLVVVDTGSTDSTIEKIKSWQESCSDFILLDVETFKDAPLNEFKERQHLLELAKTLNPDWLVRLDVDEIFEDRIHQFLPILLEPIDPQILCWRFPMKNFWRGEEKFRADGNWGQMAPFALFRNLPNQEIFNNDHPQGFHCPGAPIFQHQNIGFCSVNMLHYGYSDWSEVVRKYKWYVETDTDKRKADIGGDGDYSHLIDESNLQLINYYPNNTISLNILVKDGEWDQAAAIIRSLETVVDQFVIINTGNRAPDEEGWRVIMENGKTDCGSPRWNIDYSCYEWNDDFAAARNFGLDRCKGRWILHLDPDEKIRSQDVAMLADIISNDRVVAHSMRIINFFDDPNTPNPEANIQEAIRLFRKIDGLIYSNIVHETLDDAIKELGITPNKINRTDLTIVHEGYLLPLDQLREKLEYYEKLNERWIRINSNDPRPWYNLGVHYLDAGDQDKALEYLDKARELNNEQGAGLYQAGSTLSGMYLRTGINLVKETLSQLSAGHPQIKSLSEIVQFLDKRVGKVRHFMKQEAEEANEEQIAKNDTIAIPAWPAPAILPLLDYLTEGMIVAEIGVQTGLSSEAMLERGIGLVYCIDPWGDTDDYNECKDWAPEAFSEWKQEATTRLEPWIRENKAIIFQSTSLAAASSIEQEFDFVFIDGNHEELSVYRDLQAWWKKVKPGGYLAGHDYFNGDEFHQVKSAVDRWAKETGVEVREIADCWIARKE